MTLDDKAEFAFDDGDVFECNGYLYFIFFTQFDAGSPAGSGFDRYSARSGKKVEKGFSVEVTEYREYRFAHSVHRGTDNAFRALDVPAF